MKEASDCLKRAVHCQKLAEKAGDAACTRLYRNVAAQWRKLARDSERHKRMTWTQDTERRE